MISAGAKLLYGSGSLGYCVVQQTMNSLMMFFGTVAHNMPGFLMGTAASLGMFWDAVTDPVMGHISDRTESKFFGRRNGYMLFAMFLVAVTNVALWSLPFGFPVFAKFLWLWLGIMLMNTFNTMFQVPYHALGVELSGDYNERTVIEGYKTVFYLIGMVIPTVLMGVLIKDRKDVLQYQNLSYIAGILMLICGCLTFLGTYSHLPRLRAKRQYSEKPPKQSIKCILIEFFSIIKHKDFRALVFGYAVSLMCTAFITAAGLHCLTYTFKFEFSGIAILFGSLFAAIIFSQPLWLWLSRKLDKKPALIVGMSIALFGVAFCAVVFILYMYAGIIPDRPIWFLLPAFIIVGTGVGSVFSMPYSMMGDFVAIQAAKDKKVKTATFGAFLTFFNKVSQAVTLLIVGILLDIIRFDSEAPEQSFLTRAGLGWILITGIAVALVVGIIFYTRYRITKDDVPFNAEPGQ